MITSIYTVFSFNTCVCRNNTLPLQYQIKNRTYENFII